MLTFIERRVSVRLVDNIRKSKKWGLPKKKNTCVSSARQERFYVDSIAPPYNFHLLKFS